MALAQLGIESTQERLARAMDTRVGVGTPFSRVKRLIQWDVAVQLVQSVSISDLHTSLACSKAVIVAVMTAPGLPGWDNVRTQHAVLVVACDEDQITYHDPALSQGPVSVQLDEFPLAWEEMGARAAFLSRTQG